MIQIMKKIPEELKIILEKIKPNNNNNNKQKLKIKIKMTVRNNSLIKMIFKKAQKGFQKFKIQIQKRKLKVIINNKTMKVKNEIKKEFKLRKNSL